LRVGFLSAVVCSLTLSLTCACSAFAASTGGVSAGGTTTTTATTAPGATTKSTLHLFPVTSHSRSVAYHGPVYERTATGEVVPYQPSSQPAGTASVTTGTAASATGGSAPAGTTTTAPVTPSVGARKPQLLVPGTTARYVAGLAAAPMNAPAPVQEIIWAGNQLIGLPYIFGGGHASFIASGYDCSGTVSFALHGASLLSSPKDSSEFETWGSHGIGRWVSIFSNPGHAYMTVAGLRLDTSAADDPSNQQGPRWRPLRTANEGYVVRHPLGL
jgi:hypothetical protein